MLATAVRTAIDDAVEPKLRANCLRIALSTGSSPSTLRELFAETAPPQVRELMLAPLLRSENESMRQYIRENIGGMTLRLRAVALNACASRATDARWLLDEVAEGRIPRTMIDPDLAKRLRSHPDSEVVAKATQLLKADPNRLRVLTQYARSARDLGDPHLGRLLFSEHCSACHRIDGVGTNVGPDISDTRAKSAEALLASILDPNAAIDSAFVQFQVLTTDGLILDGLLVDETAQAVTLQQKGGERVSIPRAEIERIQAPGVSLMPEGFERTIDPEAMSHLLSYLKNWRYMNRAIPGTLREVSSPR